MRISPAQDLLKGASELRTPAVDQGVEGGVGVADPVQDPERQHDVVHLPDGRHHVKHEKRQPAEGECSHDDPQGLQSFVVLQAELGPPVLHLIPLLGAEALCAYASLNAIDFLKLPTGLLEDPAVHKYHDEQRDVEGDDGGGHGVGGVGVEVAAGWLLQAFQCFRVVGQPPLHVDGQERDQGGHCPNPKDNPAGLPLRKHRLIA